MHIRVIGPGCKKCHETDKLVREVVRDSGSDATVEYINDIAEMAKLGIFTTPAVIVDGQVKSVGKIPSKTDIAKWLGK